MMNRAQLQVWRSPNPNDPTIQMDAKNLATTGAFLGGSARVKGWKTSDVSIAYASINNSAGIVVSTPSAAGTNAFGIAAPLLTWLTVTLLWVSVGWLLIRMRRNRTTALADEPRLHQPGENPPDAEKAERNGHEALEIVPCWHYAHDLLLPQIAEAKAKQAKQSP